MATLESTIGKEGKSTIRRNFLNTNQSKRGAWYNRRRYEF